MIRVVQRDEAAPFRPAGVAPVLERHLQRHFHRRRSVVGVKHPRQTRGNDFEQTLRQVNGRNCLEVGGVWIDEAFTPKTAYVTVKAQSDAYFRILERHEAVKDVYRLGNHLVWVTPSNSALVIDASNGVEQLSDADINRLFVAPPKKAKQK